MRDAAREDLYMSSAGTADDSGSGFASSSVAEEDFTMEGSCISRRDVVGSVSSTLVDVVGIMPVLLASFPLCVGRATRRSVAVVVFQEIGRSSGMATKRRHPHHQYCSTPAFIVAYAYYRTRRSSTRCVIGSSNLTSHVSEEQEENRAISSCSRRTADAL